MPPRFLNLLDDLEKFDMSENADPEDYIVSAFTLHVSNLGHMSEESIFKTFSQFGKVVYCTAQIEKNLDRYALVTYRKYSEARRAVEQVRRFVAEKGQPRLLAEIMDTYYWYHYQQGLRDMEAQQAEFANQMKKIQQMSQQQTKFSPVDGERQSNVTQNRGQQDQTAPMANPMNTAYAGQQVLQQNGQQVTQQNGQQPVQQQEQSMPQQQQMMQQQPVFASYQMYQMPPTGNGQQYFYQTSPSGPTYYAPVFVPPNQMYQMPMSGANMNQMYAPQQQQVRVPTVVSLCASDLL